MPAEWLKAMRERLYELSILEHNKVSGEPPTAAAFFTLAQCIWQMSHIPSIWRTADLWSLHKAGDLTSMDNYRGISLIPVALKVISKVVINCISSVLTAAGHMAKEQAGFCTKEECIGQVLATASR
jgi:hypothetical protein